MLRSVTSMMSARRAGSLALALFLAAVSAGAANAETSITFSLFRYEGPAAPFLVPLDKGYYKAEGLDVSFATVAGVFDGTDRIRQDVDLFTARINYKFGGPVVARY